MATVGLSKKVVDMTLSRLLMFNRRKITMYKKLTKKTSRVENGAFIIFHLVQILGSNIESSITIA